jgi:NADH-quinone oxidoreductase subunit L
MFFLTFHGTYRNHHHSFDKVHESPIAMTLPLMILAVLSVFGGLLNLPHFIAGHSISGALAHYLAPIYAFPEKEVELTATTEWILMGAAVAVFLVAYLFTRAKYVTKNAVPEYDEQQEGLGKVLANKFYIDEIYDSIFVKPMEKIGDFIDKWIDGYLLKGFVDGFGKVSQNASGILSKIQNGNVEYYLIYMAVAVSILLAFNLF